MSQNPEPEPIEVQIPKSMQDWAAAVLADLQPPAEVLTEGPETPVQHQPDTKYDRRLYCPNCGHKRNDSDH